MKNAIRRLARAACGEYEIYRIYACRSRARLAPVEFRAGLRFERIGNEPFGRADPLIAEQRPYHGNDARCYACFDGERVISVCFFWYGERYRARNFWPLADREAKLVQIITLPGRRGEGVASQLIHYASDDMFRSGFEGLYARIWHSNTASRHAFKRAGWTPIALVVRINPLRRPHPWRLAFRRNTA